MLGFVIVILVNCFLLSSIPFSRAEVLTASLGDFIEFHSGIKNCNSTIRSKIVSDFSKCTSTALNAGTISKIGDTWTRACENKAAYLACWDPVVQKSGICNAGSNVGAPSVYKASLQAICGTDNGKSNAEKLTQAMDAALNNPAAPTECSATGDHWARACKSFKHEINSKDTCKRHRGLSKCVSTITCKEQAAGKLFIDTYDEAKKYISGC